MEFQKVGKAYQLVIRNGNDLADALTLDEALWVAMSAPVKAYTCDPKVLAYIDAPKLGSITTETLKGAIRWLLDVYADRKAITDHSDGKLPLASLTDSETAKKIAHSATYILNDLAAADKSAISLEQVREFQRILTSRPLNGDGVLSLLAAGEASTPELAKEIRDFIEDAAKATGGTKDLDGTMGVTLAQFKEFHDAIPQYLEWRKAGALPDGATQTALLPFGAETPAKLALLDAHAEQVEEFFRLCEMLSFDPRLAKETMENDGKPSILDRATWPGQESFLKTLPIAQPVGPCALPANSDYINPLYRTWWDDVVKQLFLPILGSQLLEESEEDAIGREEWQTVQAVFAPYRAYIAAKKGACCEGIDLDKLEHYATLSGLVVEAESLEKKDLSVAQILAEASDVEKALLYLRWLVKIANNFISFPDLYEPKVPTLFERGKVVIDGRWFNITFPVDNLAAHSALATNSGLFLIYVEVDTKPAQTLCAPVTIGDKGNLTAGKRGIFFATDGQTYNAKIAKVIENPVCLKEAIVAPFSKFGKMAENKVAAMSSSSETAITGKMSGLINDPKAAAAAATAQPPAAKSAGEKSGMLMGLGIAFAALSSALAFICKTVADMSGVAILVSLLCVLAVLVAPIMLLAVIRLRRQDLSSLLEGNGWAINARMRLTCRQRHAFSRGGLYPAKAKGTPCRRRRAWIVTILLVIILAAAGYTACKLTCHSCPNACENAPETVQETVQETQPNTAE